MKVIELSNGMKTLVDDEDYFWLMEHKWHAMQQSDNYFYAARTDNSVEGGGKTILMHRAIMERVGKRGLIEHEDGDGLNNQKYNLRESSNSRNQLLKNSGGVTVLKQVNPSWKR